MPLRAKKPRPIDQLVRWAYREELPKAQPVMPNLGLSNAWNSIASLAALGQRVQEPDVRNRYGLVPDLVAQNEPHPDAVAIWASVQDLADMVLTLPEDWNPLSDMGDLGPQGAAAIRRGFDRIFAPSNSRPVARQVGNMRRFVLQRTAAEPMRLRRSASELVQHHAIMGTFPDWRADKPERCVVKHSNGQPKWFIRETIETAAGVAEYEADGMDRKLKRPKPNAFQKHYLDPDPSIAVAARAEYEIWIAAMASLAEDLVGRLDDFEPIALATNRPWEPAS